MKKSICILLTAVACLLCLAGPAAAEYIKFSKYNMLEITGIDDTVYVLTGRAGVWSWKPGDQELTLYESGYEWPDYEGLVAVDGVLYTVNKENYQFTGIGENGCGAPLDGVAIPDFKKTAHLGRGWSISSMRNTPCGLFWKVFPKENAETEMLCRLDLSTMKLSCRAVSSIFGIFSYWIEEDGTIWVIQQKDGGIFSLCTLDWDSGKLIKVDELPRGSGGMIMKDGDMYFLVKKGQIIRRKPDGSIETVGQVPIRQNNHKNSLLLNNDVVVYVDMNEMASFSLSEAQEQ